jgi:glycosyltransferase involved in cell wall biosynthesis
MALEHTDVLMVGIGQSAPLWYRMALPARHMGWDWVGVKGQPPSPQLLTGIVRGDTQLPHYSDYKVVVLQQVSGRAWLGEIQRIRAMGVKVLYECDDYLHGTAKQKGHDFAQAFTKKRLLGFEMCMRACDGMIVSTPYLARRYAKFNRNIYICENGIDLDRYQLTRPPRDSINIGWAGATGHLEALLPWVSELMAMMREDARLRFVSIGEPGVAQAVGQELGNPRRAMGIPFIPMESYPSAMTNFDIALAPGGDTAWYRAKSDLRWLEASALGMPTVADPRVYDNIEDGVTGFHATTPAEMSSVLRTLIDDPDLRERVGEQAREEVTSERSSEVAAMKWLEVCSAVAGGYESLYQLQRSGGRS